MCSVQKEKNQNFKELGLKDGRGKGFILNNMTTLGLDKPILSSELGLVDKMIRELCACIFIDHFKVINIIQA